MKKNCFIILGMHRSGTSVTTGLLSYFDLTLGSALINPNEENPKGFFENRAVLDLNKKILHAYNSNWDDYHFKLNNIDSNQIKSWVDEAEKVLQQEFSNSKNFAIKDPRLCLLFPIWEQALKNFETNVKIIIVNRHPSAVAKSLKTRNNFSNQKSVLLWANYTLELEYFSREHERLLIQYPANFVETTKLISELKKFTKLSISDTQLQKAIAFYDNSLTRHEIDQNQLENDTPPPFAQLSSIFDFGDISKSSEFDLIRKEFEMTLNFFSENRTILEKNKELAKKSTQIRQRNERITRLTSDIEEIEISISQRIESDESEITVLEQKLSETKLEAIQFSQRTSNLANTYLRDRQKSAWIKGLYKHKKDKRLIQKINRLQLRLQTKFSEAIIIDNTTDDISKELKKNTNVWP